jgi:formylglycine-generating enzyme required for sulfatase activity
LIAASGWQSPAWDAAIAPDEAKLTAAVQCDALYQTWSAAGHDTLPMNCVDWYEAFAFCVWDGGRLPTDAEWQYAAAGGAEQRSYPWGIPLLDNAPDTSAYASYFCLADDGACGFTDIVRVGSKPLGVGKYGQLDLSGSMAEWALDLGSNIQQNPCDNCANLSFGNRRVIRGGNWADNAQNLSTADHRSANPGTHGTLSGFRCARPN